MSLLKAVMQRLGKMVCLFTTPSMGQMDTQQPNVSKLPVKFGQQTQDAQGQSKPARQTYKRKLSAAQADTKGQSLKRIQRPAPVEHTQDGSQQIGRAHV